MTGWQELLIILVIAIVMYFVHTSRAESMSDEELGEEVRGRLASKFKLTKLNDEVIDAIIDRFRSVRKWRFENVRVYLSDERGINATALPGGTILLTESLYASFMAGDVNEEEIAGVIAHEVGHVELRHGRRGLRRMAGVESVGFLLRFRFGPIVSGGKYLAKRVFTHQNEYEADHYSLELLRDSGFDPAGLGSFLKKASSEDMPDLAFWLTDHPPTRRRLERISEFMKGLAT